jgi:hypothetical protein
MAFVACADIRVAQPRTGRDEARSRVAEEAHAVVLVTVDGVRWQEIFDGVDPVLGDAAGVPPGPAREAAALTPNFHRLFFEGGTALGDPRRGAPLRASGPHFVSLPSYVELMTGRASGCVDNDCEPHVAWALADAIAVASPREGAAVFASWERIARAVPARVASVFRSAGRAPGDVDGPFPGQGEYRPDRRTAALALDHLERARPRFLWVALGDTDEHAHRGDYGAYLGALRDADAFVGALAARLEAMGDRGARTSILVTTDHGRDAGFTDHGGPASGSVWLLARGGPVAKRGALPLARPRHLVDVAPTVRALLGEPARPCRGCGAAIDELL